MATVTCPNGHESNDPEWCDTCGAKLGAAAPPAGDPAAPPPPAGTPAADGARRGERAAAAGRSRRRRAVPALRHAERAGQPVLRAVRLRLHHRPAPARRVRRRRRPGGAGASTPERSAGWSSSRSTRPGSRSRVSCPTSSARRPARRRWRWPATPTLVGRTSQSRGVRPEIALDNDTGRVPAALPVRARGRRRQRRRPVLDERDVRRRRRHHARRGHAAAGGRACRSSSATAMPVFVGAWSRLTLRRAEPAQPSTSM